MKDKDEITMQAIKEAEKMQNSREQAVRIFVIIICRKMIRRTSQQMRNIGVG